MELLKLIVDALLWMGFIGGVLAFGFVLGIIGLIFCAWLVFFDKGEK